METTKVFSDALELYIEPDSEVRTIVLKGGTRSSKTYSTIQLLDQIARAAKRQILISVVSETMPHLKKGAIRDFKDILKNEKAFNQNNWHDTDKIYSYENAQIEFFSADTPSKVHGPARDILYINECINVPYEVYRQLAIRTRGKIILDYNPAHRFWVDDKVLIQPHARLITSTYKDNDRLTASQIMEIESNRDIDPDWWKVYGMGEIGSTEGLCIKKWSIIPKMPEGPFKKEYGGIDFGWSKPTAAMHVAVGETEKVYINQILYNKGMDNPQIAQAIKDAGLVHLEWICDAAEPKSIQELRNHGINAVSSKNKDIKLGLAVMNRFDKYYTADSLGSIDENRKYHYKRHPITGEYTGEPIDEFNHAKDAERYVFLNRLSDAVDTFDITATDYNYDD